jgi:hypothetical protein
MKIWLVIDKYGAGHVLKGFIHIKENGDLLIADDDGIGLGAFAVGHWQNVTEMKEGVVV